MVHVTKGDTMDDVIIRQETPAQNEAIERVNISAFGGDAEAKLITQMRQSKTFIPELSLIAQVNGRVVGHILLSAIEIVGSEGTAKGLALAPMAVMPSQSHRGIGSLLVRAGLTKAASLGYDAVVVVGHPDFYARLGFSKASVWSLRCQLPVPEDVVMAVELRNGVLKKDMVAQYPAPFKELFKATQPSGEVA